MTGNSNIAISGAGAGSGVTGSSNIAIGNGAGNNITDKNAELALDYERGRSARVGFLTNQPRTYGVYGRYDF